MNTVYILGAGASAAAAKDNKRVLGTDLLRLAFAKHGNDPRIRNVKNFVKDIFHYDEQESSSILPTVEEALSTIDIALSRGESISDEYNFSELQKLRNNFAFLIYQILEESYQTLNTSNVTTRFVEKLKQPFTVISLNYDIIIDNAMKRKFGATLDYGFEYRAYRSGKEFIKPNQARLYKIHGSLNWLVCPTCGVAYIADPEFGKVAGDAFGGSARCVEEGHAPLESLIITPTNLKTYNQPHVSIIWQKAERALRDAKKVVFIGYSLPDADFHIKYLLQKSLYRVSAPQPQIVVVDFKPGQGEHRTDEEKRFMRLFGQIKYYKNGFDDYVGRMA